MARVHLIRHGEPARAWGAGDDPGLSEAGRAQAARAAQILLTQQISDVLTSPMRRCRETAAVLENAMQFKARIEPRVSEAEAPDGADRRAWLAATFPWGEGAAATLWRDLDPTLQRWREAVIEAVRAIEQDAAVFTHFIAINALVGAALGEARTIVARPALGSVTVLDVTSGALRIETLGEQLREGLAT
jgi:broad specificity phosphatase PhoE